MNGLAYKQKCNEMKKLELIKIIKEEISKNKLHEKIWRNGVMYQNQEDYENKIAAQKDVEEEIKEYMFGKLKEVEDVDGPNKAKEIIEFLIQILQVNLKDLKTRL